MKKDMKKVATTIVGNLARKIAESAVHAAVFAFVSKKVTDLLDRNKEKEKVRVESSPTLDTPEESNTVNN
jgi:hypothetical protein